MTVRALAAVTSTLVALAASSTVEANRTGRIASVAYQPAPMLSTTAYAAGQAPARQSPLASLFEDRSWLNTQPLKAEDLRGKVVLVHFWTYSCINVLRTLPYVRNWAEKYRNHGLVVIGVHTPEFAFEKNAANVRGAIPALGVRHPVILDNEAGVWRAFNNDVWPALYLIGTDGRIRHRALGEGGYDRFERAIQSLLAEAGGAPVAGGIAVVKGEGPQAAADWRSLRSEETYVGYALAKNFASPGGFREDASAVYRGGPALALNQWSLAGVWTVGSEFASLDGQTGSLGFRFHARDLHLVLAPRPDGRPIRFRVLIDGSSPGVHHGADINAEGWGSVQQARLYQLIRQQRPVAPRTFEIEFFEAGVRVYAFTFG